MWLKIFGHGLDTLSPDTEALLGFGERSVGWV